MGATVSEGARRAMLVDVASRAGVSVATASLALRGAARVTPATRERVRVAASDLGYRSGGLAARSQERPALRIGIVGAVTLEELLDDPFQVTTITGLVGALEQARAVPVFFPPADEARRVALIARAQLDGVVLVHSPDACGAAWPAVTRRALPVVCLEAPSDGSVPGILWRDEDAMGHLCERIVRYGHTDAVIVTLPFGGSYRRHGFVPIPDPQRIPSSAVRNRLEAVFDSALAVSRVYETERSAHDEGERAGTAIASLASPPTVVVCQSDTLAAGVIMGLERAGLRVPQDVSVTGFDGLELPLIAPRRVTTVVQDGLEKGRRAAAQLLREIAGEAPEPDDMTLTVRDGTTLGPVRAEGAMSR